MSIFVSVLPVSIATIKSLNFHVTSADEGHLMSIGCPSSSKSENRTQSENQSELNPRIELNGDLKKERQ